MLCGPFDGPSFHDATGVEEVLTGGHDTTDRERATGFLFGAVPESEHLEDRGRLGARCPPHHESSPTRMNPVDMC